MRKQVYIRPLVPDDAFVTFKWRNHPSIWPFSGLRPDKYVSAEAELNWLTAVLKRHDELRFAICLENTSQVVGCIYLTNIHNRQAVLHIYFGELRYWGGGRAKRACSLLFEYVFSHLDTENIFIEINPKNKAAVLLSKQIGYQKVEKIFDSSRGLILDKMKYSRAMHMHKCAAKSI